MLSLPIEHLTLGTNEIRRGESNGDYHANKKAVGSSRLRDIERKSPLYFYTNFLGDQIPRKKPSAALQLGSAVHCYILEPEVFAKYYHVVPEFGDLRSAKNREAHAAWKMTLPAGAFFLEEDEYKKVIEMGSAVSKHKDARKFLERGLAECSHYYRDPETNILCKFRPDFLSSYGMALVDLKTTDDCTEDQFMRSIWNYRYDFQLAMYGQGVKEVYQKEIQRYIFIVVEKEPPYEVAVYELHESAIDRGLIDYRNCLATLKECLLKNEWPGYQNSIQPINLPNWAY